MSNLASAGKSLMGRELLNQEIPVSLTSARKQKVSSASCTRCEALTQGTASLLWLN